MSRNQCNFSYRGNRNKPIYSLKEDILGNLVLSKYDGLPVIMHHKYKKAGGMFLESKEAVYAEILDTVLADIHCTKLPDRKKNLVLRVE